MPLWIFGWYIKGFFLHMVFETYNTMIKLKSNPSLYGIKLFLKEVGFFIFLKTYVLCLIVIPIKDHTDCLKWLQKTGLYHGDFCLYLSQHYLQVGSDYMHIDGCACIFTASQGKYGNHSSITIWKFYLHFEHSWYKCLRTVSYSMLQNNLVWSEPW